MFASYTVSEKLLQNRWYNRPDLKPYPAMVPKDGMDITERSIYENHYQSFRNKIKGKEEDRKRSSWYRLLFPNKADYTVKSNPYAYYHRDDIYNPENGYVSSIHNHYRDH